MSPFEKSLWRWGELDLYWHELRERFPEMTCRVVRAEGLFADPAAADVYWDLLEFPLPDLGSRLDAAAAAGRNPVREERRDEFGLRHEWRRYCRFPWIIEQAARYGYSFNPDELHARAARYTRKKSILHRVYRRLRVRAAAIAR
jgi:hypothetical protein